jgi:hypothetical protein
MPPGKRAVEGFQVSDLGVKKMGRLLALEDVCDYYSGVEMNRNYECKNVKVIGF